jgi:hypothetical protein
MKKTYLSTELVSSESRLYCVLYTTRPKFYCTIVDMKGVSSYRIYIASARVVSPIAWLAIVEQTSALAHKRFKLLCYSPYIIKSE